MKFYNREKEMRELEMAENISNDHKIMLVLSGRRRVGKTELIRHFFCKEKGMYFFVNPKKTSSELLIEFSSIISSEFSLPEYVKIDSWDSFLKVLFEVSKEKKIIVAIDEFQWFLNVVPSIIFQIQKAWDMYRGKLFLIICGSSVGMIRKIFVEQKAPLFKRAHNILSMRPFNFDTVRSILRDSGITDIEEQIKFYSVYGGIPMYYILIKDHNVKDMRSSIDELMLRDFAPLKDEVPDILVEEFGREVPAYYAILTAISMGKNTAKEMCEHAGIKETSLAPYIENLVNVLNIVVKEVPVTEKKPLKSKKGRYFLEDNFFRFWFRYIYRDMSNYEIKNYTRIKEKIGTDINSFFGFGFEGVCREVMIKLNSAGKLGFFFDRIGRQWGRFRGEKGRNTYEIDLVALNEKTREILFCECKWQDKIDAGKIIAGLREKAKYVEWNYEKRKEYYVVFARSFKDKEKVKEPGIMLFDLHDLDE